MRNVDAADRFNRGSASDRKAWASIRGNIEELRGYILEYVEKFGPGQGAGKRRGGLSAAQFETQLKTRAGKMKTCRLEQKTQKEFIAIMTQRGQSQEPSYSQPFSSLIVTEASALQPDSAIFILCHTSHSWEAWDRVSSCLSAQGQNIYWLWTRVTRLDSTIKIFGLYT